MKKAYVITEGETDAKILKKILSKNIVKNTEFIVGSGRYSAHSLARSILAVKRLPIALVVDADTEDEAAVQEQIDFLRESLREAASGIQFEVFVAVPEIEVLFFEHPSLIRCLSRHDYSQAEWDLAKLHPKQFLRRSLGEQTAVISKKLLDYLDNQTITAIRKHPLIRSLSDFLASVIESGTNQP